VPVGAARAAAEELARELAAHPQPTLRADRLSVYEDSLESEFARGVTVLEEARRGAARFGER
jgi:enoyl-CoA hydratase